ncbi:hypothetical protein Barb7_00295 [Bacteroidales bacterium Barb7]|nr:hypothetical protein Barb7_00295 [Bacteroidales bacterium Barb7]
MKLTQTFPLLSLTLCLAVLTAALPVKKKVAVTDTPTGQVVTVKNNADQSVIYTGTYDDEPLSIKIPYDVSYTISVNDMEDYLTPSSVTYTAGQLSRAVTLDYAYALPAEIVFDKSMSEPYNIEGDINSGAIETILSKVRRCLVKKTADGAVTIAYLRNDNSNYYEDGSAAVLTGGEGDVMVYLPQFYYKLYDVDATHRGLRISEYQIDATYKKITEGLVGAYKAYVDDGKVYSRSGVRPTAEVSQADFSAYAQARGGGYDIIDYEMHCVIAFLFYAKYGTRDSQYKLGTGNLNYNAGLTGTTDAMGNADTRFAYTGAPSFLGIETAYGWYYEWVSKVVINDLVWTITNPDGTTRTVTACAGIRPPNYWLKDIAAMGSSDYIDVVPTAVGGSQSTYFCDEYTMEKYGEYVLARSCSSAYVDGGLTFTCTMYDSSYSYAHMSSRLAFRGTIAKASTIAAFKALPVL